MARRRDGWRHAARSAAYDYPKLQRDLRDLQAQSVTPNMNGMPGGGEPGRSTEDAALRQLPYAQQRRLDAVEQAVSISSNLTSGLSRVRLIELVYFQRKYTIEGAAMQIPCSVQTAWTWNNDFLLLVWSRLRGK
jgi:hypothetical protein